MRTEETFQQEYESHLMEVYLQELNRRTTSSDINPKPLPNTYDWVCLMTWGQYNFGRDVWAMMTIGATNKRNSEEGKLRSTYFKVERKPKTKIGVGVTNIPEELIEYVCNEIVEANNGGIDWEETLENCVYDDGQDGERFCIWLIESNDTVWKIVEQNDYKGPLDYGSKTLRKIQKLVREEMR